MSKYNRLIGFALIVGATMAVTMVVGVDPPATTAATITSPVVRVNQDDRNLRAYTDKNTRTCEPRGAEMAQALGLEVERQTTAIVAYKKSGAIREISYGCPMGQDDPGSLFVSWDGGIQPPPRIMALIVEAARQLTDATPDPVARAVATCLKKAVRSDMSEEIELVATEISCSTVNDAGERSGTVTISRLRSKSED